jgi:chromosome segregation ATPase
MDTSSSDSSSLSHLSSLLISHGYLSRPLLLHPTSPDPTTRRREEDKSTAQITKCLWSMLSARLSSSESLEKLGTQVRVLSYENERMEGKLSRGEREVENARKEVEKERGRTRDVERELKGEMERHKHSKEELGKARSALMAVKTQSQVCCFF